MTSLLGQLQLFFGRGQAVTPTPRANGAMPEKISLRHRRRDPMLEERARTLLGPWAPKLAPTVVVGWNARMRTTAGIAIFSRSEIWLNPSLLKISELEVEKTLLHELAHLLAQHRHGRRRLPPHGQAWRQACIDLGIPGERRTHQLPFEGRRMKRRYLLRCPACGESHRRVRRPMRRIACLACCRSQSGGVYDDRFRFEVLPIADC